MPYKSTLQKAKFHAMEAEGKMAPEVVDEFDQASKGMKLPQKIAPKKKMPAKPKYTSLDQLRELAKKMK